MSEYAQTTDEIKASFAAGYDLERELLGGGMSRVFLATERALNRKVVIKVLPPELAAGVNRERFRREVQLAAQLQHPHIVPLYSAGSQGEILYYTMPFIEGESLKHALQEKKRFSPREVLRVLHDVVDALGYAHERGVIHRDIKPGNVLRSGSHAVVTDFGVAKAISASMATAPGMTTSGMVVGSPAYMAPEQLAGDPNADHRIDLYAVGLLAYELLTGDTPFHASSPQETMAAQLTRTPAPLDRVRRDVPPQLSAVIMKSLEKRPDDRWKNAAEMLAALDAITVASGEYTAASGRNRSLVLVAAAAVVLGGFAAWQRLHETVAPTPTPRDTVTVSPAGPLLTRAESLAIAKAVDSMVASQRAAKRASDSAARAASPSSGTKAAAAASPQASADALKKMADSIRAEIEHAVFDSLSRVQQAQAQAPPAGRGNRGPGRGVDPTALTQQQRVFVDAPPGRGGRSALAFSPELDSLIRLAGGRAFGGRNGNGLDPVEFEKRAATMGPPRRVVITEPRITNRALADAVPYATVLADSLRAVVGRTKHFTIVNPDSVRAALLKTRTIDDLASGLNADVFVNISTYRAAGDSATWQVTLRDQTANGAYALRSWTTGPTPIHGQGIAGLDTLLKLTTTMLGDMDRAPRRPPPPTAPGGPLSKEAFDARAASMGPPRRLIVWTHPPDKARPDLEAAGNALMETLRNRLAGDSRYTVVSPDETMNVLAKTRTREQVTQLTHADMMLTVRGVSVRPDSVQWSLTGWDLTANDAYQVRALSPWRTALAAPSANADSLYRAAKLTLDMLDKAPRKAP